MSALVPASAGASAPPTPVALTATPAHVTLAGSARTSVRVSNSGTSRVAVDVSRAGFAVDLRGRPRIVRSGRAGSAAPWLTFRPTHFTLGPRSSASLSVAAKLPPRVDPGDHDALILLRTRPVGSGRVAVRLRIGIVVVVRAPGRVVRRLELGALRAVRRKGGRLLELVVLNRGNVTETLEGVSAVLSRPRTGRRVATLVARSREVRARTRGILDFPFRARARGAMTARVVIPSAPGRSAIQRTYRIRL